MGTTWAVKLVTVREVELPAIRQGIERRLAEVVAQMSTWEPTSNLSRYNAAPAGQWHDLPPAFFEVLRCSLDVASQSQGAFDPSAGAIVNAWGFGPIEAQDERATGTPSPLALERARDASGWLRIDLDRDTHRVRQPGGATLDLSAIAKGFAVDHVARYLHELGIADSLVEVGGELRGDGVKPDGQPWWVELEEPDRDRAPDSRLVIALHDLSVATSGDYRRFRMVDGRRLSHTIDPRTGAPIDQDLASVTVVHRECMLADAWSTALGVMGVHEGLAMANARRIAARFVVRSAAGFEERLSEPLQAMLA